MKYNWYPDRVAFLDFETQSEADLTTVHKYSSHPSTRVLTCVTMVDGEIRRMGPYLSAEDKSYLAGVAASRTIVAHNAPFDAAMWRLEGLPEAEWFDTLPCARAAGLPGQLDRVSKIITGHGKDKRGKMLIDMLCKLKPGKPVPLPSNPVYRLLLNYNAQDVEELQAVYGRVKDFVEPKVMSVDRVINDRGVPADADFLERLSGAFAENEADASDKFEGMAGGVNAKSSKQVVEWLKSQGFAVPSISRVVFKDLMANPENFFSYDCGSDFDSAFQLVQEALEMRREIVRVGKSKAAAALSVLDSDGRMREQLVYWGAHTGRWSARKFQMHNLPHAVKEIDVVAMEPEYKAVKAAAIEASEKAGRRIAVSDVLNSMLRHAVRGVPLCVADYAAVEPRVLAWVSNCSTMLRIYSDPYSSVYEDMGEKLFRRKITKVDYEERNFAKALILGCGYGMSGNKFEHLCKVRNARVEKLREANLDIKQAVKKYRDTYPEIPAVWREYHDAVHACAGRGESVDAGRCVFVMVGPDMHMVLPSGRAIVYRNARIEMLVPGYCRLYGMPETPVPTVVYDHPRGNRGFLYGSKVCENAVQGISRDLMADAVVELEEDGMDPVFHVHDEGACQKEPKYLERMLEIMSVGPSWAEGLPVLVEGYAGDVWTKQTKGFVEKAMLNGRLV